jgi:hypothetical protein
MADPNIMMKSKVIKPEDVTIDDLRYMAKDSFAMWALTSGVQVDYNIFDFDHHRYLLPIYMDSSKHIVWVKAAQLGATVYMLLRCLWWLENNQGRKAGLYFPTKEGVENLSSDRLGPLIKSCPSIAAIAREGDKLGLKKIGESSFYLYHLGGVASKDSVPLDFLAFDEVRLCDAKDIDQARERISHSPYKYETYMSTCGLPDNDIHARYTYGSQHVWHAKCGCKDGCDLPRAFPDCVVHDDPRRPGEVYLRCPRCKWEIKDPQNGKYIPQNPGADYNSYHVSQFASKFISPKEIWNVYNRTTNMEEFYNAKLGLPYVDAENRGVTMAQLEASVNPNLSWKQDKQKGYTAMGVDQGGGYCMVVIADYNEDRTKKRIRHVEIIEQNNPTYFRDGQQVSPFVRLAELMDEWNVKICVCDAMPNYNDGLQFAQKFPGRVFLAWYAHEAKEVVQFGDKEKYKHTIRKAGPLLKFKYTAQLGRFPSLSFSLGEWAAGNVELPNPDALVQMAREEKTGLLSPQAPARRLFSHLPRLIKRWNETDEESGRGRWEWVYAGGDPHLAHAWNYCNVALERMKRATIFTFG